MDKTRVRTLFRIEFLGQVSREAERLDRSMSWVLGEVLRAALPDIESLDVQSMEVSRARTSELRDPLQHLLARANVALAESDDPGSQAVAALPDGFEIRSFFFDRPMFERLDAQADRLSLSIGEIFEWAWSKASDVVCSRPTV